MNASRSSRHPASAPAWRRHVVALRCLASLCGTVLGFADTVAQALPANVFWYDADPFLEAGAARLGSHPVPDWTSQPAGPIGATTVAVETFTSAGLTAPVRRAVGAPPPGAGFLLVNQYADDISVFQLAATPPGLPPGDADGNALVDAWELRHFGKTGIDPGADPDRDGFTNLAEAEAGTDPNDAASRPSIPGIVARWSGDGTTADAAGAHAGTWIGREAYAPGMLARGFAFDGSSAIRLTDAPDLQFTGNFSLAAWVRLDSVGCNPIPLIARSGSTPGSVAWMLSIGCQGPRLTLGTASATFNDGPVFTPSPGVWYHLAATWDGHLARLYVNGRPAFGVLTSVGFGPLDIVPGNLLYLGHNGHTLFANGTIDEAVVAARALSDEEIRWLAGGNSGRRGAIPVDGLLVEGSDHSLWLSQIDGTGAGALTHGFDARLSPDRSRLAFRRDPTSPTRPGLAPEQLWIRDLITGDESAAFSFDQGRQWESFDWAADGSAILIANSVTRRIVRRDLTTGERSVIVDTTPFGGSPVELSISRATGRLAWRHQTGAAATEELWVAQPDGSDPRSIPGTRSANPLQTPHFPAWSPSGHRIVHLGGRLLVSLTANGSGRSILFEPTGLPGDLVFSATTPAWTPDATAVVTVGVIPSLSPLPRILAIAADGTSATTSVAFSGPVPAAVVYAGGVPTEPPPVIGIVLTTPAQPGGVAELQFELEPGTRTFRLEALDTFGTPWRPQEATLRESGGRRRLVVPLAPTITARYFRLRRED